MEAKRPNILKRMFKSGKSKKPKDDPRKAFGLKVMFEGKDPTVDLVAVHGLNGHFRDSFTHPETDTCWLSDFLRDDFPDVRVLSYGYDVRTHSTSALSQNHLHQHSKQLVGALSRKRTASNSTGRPIVFVCHNLGGLVVKQALVSSNSGTDNHLLEEKDIKESTYGIMFFGTPHQGSRAATAGQMLARMASVAMKTNSKYIKHLEANSEWLAQLQDAYTPMMPEFKTVYFYEEYATDIPGVGLVHVVPHHSACVSGHVGSKEISINDDHRGMVCYPGKDDEGYATVKDVLSNMLAEQKRSPKIAISRLTSAGSHIPWEVGFSKNEDYVSENAKLKRILRGRNGKHLRIGVCGMGGVGKPQDVLDALYDFRGRVPVFWVYGGSKQRFARDYRKLAKKLDVLISEDPEDDFRTGVREHLESLPDWILVVDNADDQANFFPSTTHSGGDDKDAAPLSMFLPQGCRGTLIITTHDKEVAAALCSGNIIQKSVMGPEHAMELFMNHYKEPRAENIPELLELLEYLPLAVVQAAKYMSDIMDHLMTPAEYIDDFKSTRTALKEPVRDIRRESGYDTVLTIFALTFKLVETQSSIAFCILKAIGCVECHQIPTRVLECIGETKGENIEVKRALGKLENLGLIKQTADANSYEMHRLTHLSLVQRLQTRGVEREDTSALCYKVLVGLLPDPNEYTSWSMWDQYISHVKNLVNHGGANTALVVTLCIDAAKFYMGRGNHFRAEEMGLRARDTARMVHGETHRSTMHAIHQLAWAYLRQSRLKEAEELFVQVLDARKITLGKSHPDTLTTMHALAQVYLRQSRLKKAEELSVQVLDAEKIILGESHPNTLATMHGLAQVYLKQSRLKEAEELFVQVLDAKKIILGESHPDTLPTMHELARVYLVQSRLKEAEELFVQVLDANKNILDGTHPNTLATMHGLAQVYLRQSYLDKATGLWDEVKALGVANELPAGSSG